MENVEMRVIEILRNLGEFHQDFQIKPEDFLSELGLNSMLFIKFIVLIESEFDVEFGDENLDIGKFNTLSNIISYLESILK